MSMVGPTALAGGHTHDSAPAEARLWRGARAAYRALVGGADAASLLQACADALVSHGAALAVRVHALGPEPRVATAGDAAQLALLPTVIAPLGPGPEPAGSLLVALAPGAPDDAATILAELAHDLGLALQDAGRRAAAAAPTRGSAERRRVERAVEERLARALVQLPEAIVLFDADLDVRFVNPAGAALLGLTGPAPGDDEAAPPCPPELQRAWLPAMRQALATGAPQVIDVTLARPDGERALRTTLVPLSDDRGAIVELVAASQDRTPELTAERALRERVALGERLAAVAATVPGLVCTFELGADERVRMSFATAQVEDVFGFTQAEAAAGFAWLERLAPEGRALVAERWARAVASWSTLHLEYRYAHPRKGWRWHESWSVPTPGPDGRIIWHSCILDVTGRKLREESLRESERRLAIVFHGSPVPKAIVRNADDRVIDCNQALARLLGCARAELLGATAASLGLAVPRPPEPAPADADARARPHGHDAAEVELRLPDGAPRTLLVSADHLDVAGDPCTVIMLHDLTPIRQAERALRRSEERFRAVFEQAAIGLGLVDVATRRFVRVNRSFCAYLGYDEAELLALGPEAVSHPDDVGVAREAVAYVTGGDGLVFRRAKRYRRKDGTTTWGLLSVSRLWFEAEDTHYLLGVVQDIDAAKAAEAQLAEAEEHQRLALDAAELGTWRLDLPSGAVALDARGQAHFGFAAAQVPLATLLGALHPDDRPALEAALTSACRGEGDGRFGSHVRVPLARDELRWLSLHVWVRFAEAGPGRRPAFAIATSRDITAQKQVESALRERLALQERLANAIATMPGSLFTFELTDDGAARVVYSSTVEIPPSDRPDGRGAQIAASYVRRIDADDVAAGVHKLRDAARTGSPLRLEFRVHDRERGELWLQATCRPERSADGRLLFHGFLAEITDRKRADEALRASEERYRALVDHMDDLVFSTDLDGRLTFVNPAIARTGLRADEVVGRLLWSLAHAADAARVEQVLLEVLEGALLDDTTARALEWRIVGAGDKAMVVRMALRPLVLGGRLRGTTGVAVDVTRQRETEEQLRVAQRMEAVGRLAGGVAHDFNNLLAVIISYASFAKEDVRAEDPLHGDLEEVLRAARRAEALTRQLLAFSRRQVLQPVPIDLRELVAGMEKMLRRLIGEDIELHVVPSATLAITQADPGQIEQVVMNLAVNARDAMPDGGHLRLATADVVLDGARAAGLEVAPGAYVELRVSDTGSGMPPDVLARIFEPFFTTKELGKGTGLGLSTVYGIIKQSGGAIGVETRLGQGTTFAIYLPRHVSDAPVSRAPALERSVARGHEAVLVVEDEPAVRSLIHRILRSAGYEVLLAANGGEALLLCERHGSEIRLVLTDVVMPGMNGRELAERLASVVPGLATIFMSGYTDEAIARHGVLEPGVHFLPKPFDAQALTRLVRRVLDATTPAETEPAGRARA